MHAIVFLTYFTDPTVIGHFEKLSGDMLEDAEYKIHLYYDKMPNKVELDQIKINECDKVGSFKQTNWHLYKKSTRFHDTFIPGNSETAFLMFYDDYPHYDYYWFIEYDVAYSGSWHNFFDFFTKNQSDLLTTTLCYFNQIPSWGLWKTLASPKNVIIDEKNKVRAFMPICRLSNYALQEIKEGYAQGWKGHSECVLPTLVKHSNLVIEDIGGNGEFVKSSNINQFYSNTILNEDLSPGTFKFRPILYQPGNEPNKLWHPVKSHKIKSWDREIGILESLCNKIKNRLNRLFPSSKHDC